MLYIMRRNLNSHIEARLDACRYGKLPIGKRRILQKYIAYKGACNYLKVAKFDRSIPPFGHKKSWHADYKVLKDIHHILKPLNKEIDDRPAELYEIAMALKTLKNLLYFGTFDASFNIEEEIFGLLTKFTPDCDDVVKDYAADH